LFFIVTANPGVALLLKVRRDHTPERLGWHGGLGSSRETVARPWQISDNAARVAGMAE
jgi:hypothetical protein